MSLPEDEPVHALYTDPHMDPRKAERPEHSEDQEGQRTTRTSSPMRIFRADLNHFKDNMLNAFKDSRCTLEDPENTSALSLLKEDLNQFREDMSSVFRTADNANTDIKESTEEQDQNRRSEEQKDHEDAKRTILKPRRKKTDTKDNNDVLQETTTGSCVSWPDSAGDHHEEEEEEEEGPSKSLPSDFLVRMRWLDGARQPLDAASVKNFACYLTFDPNTANGELRLSECNRKATRVWSDQRPGEPSGRFLHCPQVLCREGQLDAAYWEVQWSGGADVGVAYNNISRDGDVASCLLGHNRRSWSVECSAGSYLACHDNKRVAQCTPRPFTHRVGVYLDWPAGSLSFYCISKETMVHIHTFTSTFTEPLYPAFWVWSYHGSVSLCQVELDWERLLH
ncbi:uncharacterized protein [Nerophis lumbriciformis]|uniref:uncharacterized protein n=1 Tax=Nerophis lumbriciformis TaxID=546530 RepID=UPI003BAD150F